MPTLNINGKRVQVGEEFLSLTPDEQNAAVDEIAASIGVVNLSGKVGQSSGQRQPSSNVEWAPGQQPAQAPPKSIPERLMNSTTTTVEGLVNGIPVVGPAAQNLADAIGGTVAQVASGDLGPVLTPDKHAGNAAYQDYVQGAQDRRDQRAAADPLARTAGELASGIGSFVAAGNVPAAASALGLTGKLLPASIASGVSTYGIGVADSLAHGASPQDAMTENLAPAAVAAAIPGAGRLVKEAGKAVNENLIRPIMTAADPGNEAIRRVGRAIATDTAVRPGMSAAQEQIARQAGADVVNADRFGSATRSLARASANVSPEAKGVFDELTQQRFYTQSARAAGFIKQLMGGATDDLALQDTLRSAARATNKAAYDAAYAAPQAKAIWTPEIRQLMQADPFRTAVREAEKVGANDAAISGGNAIRNPFVFNQDGQVVGLRKLADGNTALPNLQFWDIVQRNLRQQAEAAARAGRNLDASQIGQMRTQLLTSLDGAVPKFRDARRGAAGFFGAEDALDAGKVAAKSPRSNAEIGRAVNRMSPAEKDAFAVGFSSELTDMINASRDRVNVINSIFTSPSMRERIIMAIGPQKAKALEAYVKVEQILDMTRMATQGNSSTAQQLIAAGAVGTGAGWLATGNLQGAGTWGGLAMAGRAGMRALGKRVDEQTMRLVAEMLSSTDPNQVQKSIRLASVSRQQMLALDAIMQGLMMAGRGAVMASGAGSSP